jgi:hypothetical protein
MNYPQHLDEEHSPASWRHACSNLREYIGCNEDGFLDAVQRNPGLKITLEDLLWLQRAVLNTPCSSDEVDYTLKKTMARPTMSLCDLLAEIEECAWFVLSRLEEMDQL